MFKRILFMLFISTGLSAGAYCAEGSISICPTGRCAIRCGRVFGGEKIAIAYSVEEMTDGGFVVSGFITAAGQGRDAWLLRLDSEGNEVWNKTFGGDRKKFTGSMVRTADEGGVFLGTDYSLDTMSNDLLVLKTDPLGNMEWEKLFDARGEEFAKAVAPTSDGGVIIAGDRLEVSYERGPKSKDGVVMKLDASGNREWSKKFGSGRIMEDLNSIRQTLDGGYIVVGGSGREMRAVTRNGIWVFKLDESGNEEWSEVLEGEGANLVNSAVQTPDGGYMLVGFTAVERDPGDLWVMKLDPTGNPEWEELYGDRGRDEAYSIEKTSDGGYIVAGYTTFGHEGTLLRLDEEGYMVWAKTYGEKGHDILSTARETSDGGFIAVGSTTTSFGARNLNFWVTKVDADGDCVW